jgi:hypothetical protein
MLERRPCDVQVHLTATTAVSGTGPPSTLVKGWLTFLAGQLVAEFLRVSATDGQERDRTVTSGYYAKTNWSNGEATTGKEGPDSGAARSEGESV